jgi:hypothetical protein
MVFIILLLLLLLLNFRMFRYEISSKAVLPMNSALPSLLDIIYCEMMCCWERSKALLLKAIRCSNLKQKRSYSGNYNNTRLNTKSAPTAVTTITHALTQKALLLR